MTLEVLSNLNGSVVISSLKEEYLGIYTPCAKHPGSLCRGTIKRVNSELNSTG